MLSFLSTIFKKKEAPKVLYKYISDEKFKYYFPKLTIAFPKLSLLNDPMEATIENVLQHIQEVYHHKFTFPDPKTSMLEPGMGMRPWAYQKRFDREMEEKRINNIRLQMKAKLLDYCKENLGILSLTTNPLNPVMWSHYSNVYKGVCIGFFSESLVGIKVEDAEILKNYSGIFKLQKVKYKNKSPRGLNLTTEDYALAAFTTKVTKWSYEEEFRVLRPIIASNKNVLIVEMPPETIKEVFIGGKSIINQQIEIFPTHIDLFSVRQNQNDYKLYGEKIYRS